MKKYLSYYLKGFLIFSLILTGITNTYASHIVGMDMNYSWVSGDTYTITVVAYGDCGPSSAVAFATLPTSTPVVCIYNGNTYVTSITLAIVAPSAGVEITPVCPGVATQCTSATSIIPGIKKFIYSANYTLPSTSTAWRFVFTGNMGGASAIAGRAGAITNILPGTNTELIDTLNNSIYNSSSPVLTVVPTPFFCLDNYDGYNPGAVDAVGDSLSFSLVPGVNGDGTDCIIGTPVTYVTPYTGANPLGVMAGTFSVNSATGQILFYPNITQRALVVYNIEEYYDGTLVGTCQREMTFLVQTCTEPPPGGILSSASAGTLVDSTDFKICSGTGPFSILMNPTEPDAANDITVTASGLPAGATFTTVNNGTNHPNCTFSWTTTGVAPGTYIFYVTFTDNNCPINGSQTRSYTVTILPQPTISITGATSVCQGSSTALAAGGASAYIWSPSTGLSCTSCASPAATPSVTATYTITGTGANGCTNTASVTITVNPVPVVTISPAVSICSGASTTLTSTGGGTYSWTPATGLSCTTCSNPVANPASTTLYSLTVTGADGCNKGASTTVTVDIPAISAGPPVSICAGVTTTLSPAGAVSYVWSPGTGLSCTSCSGPVANPAVTTVYSVTGTDAAGCVGSSSVTITRLAAVTVTAPGISYCKGFIGTVTASGATTYAWSPAAGLSCTNCAAPTVSATATATYTVTGTVGTCTATAAVVVTVNPLPTLTTSPPTLICGGTSTPLTVSGAATYSWSPTAGLSCTTCTGPTASPAATTTYSVTGIGADGCQSSSSIAITVDVPAISAGSPVSLCPVQTTTLTPTGGVSYVWSPGAGLSCTSCINPVANPAATTVYTVIGTDASGCSGTAEVTITRLLTLPVSVPAIAICSGLSGTLTASGATTYTWSPAAGLSCTNCATPTADPAATSTYTVIGSNGICTGTATVTVTVNPLPTITATGTATQCIGNPSPLSASGGVSYTWLPASGLSCYTCTSPSATPATTTAYTVTGTDANGCKDTSSVVITINPLPTISAGPPASICAGSYSTTLAPSGGVSYTWSPGTGLSCTSCMSPIASPTITTVYTVTGTDANGCQNTNTVTITRLAPVVITVAPIAVCLGASGTVTASGAGSYLWTPAATLSCSTCSGASATPAVTTTYTIAGVLGACTDTTTVTVTVNPLPVVSVSGGAIRCIGQADLLTASGGSLYSWGPAIGLSCLTCVTTNATPVATTTYTVTGYNSFGCSATASTTVTINPLPGVTAVPGAVCYGSDTTLTAAGAVTYTWSPSTGLAATTGASVVASPTSTVTYTVTGTDANGCSNTISDPVVVNPIPPAPAVVSPVSYCQNVTASQLSATGTDLQWYTTPTGVATTTAPTPQTATQGVTVYYVSQVVNGCPGPLDSIAVTVFVNAITAFNYNIKYGCYFDTLSLTNNSQYVTSYLWSFGDGSLDTAANPVHYYYAVKDTTTYIIKLNGYVPSCYSDSASDTITLLPSPIPFTLTNVTPAQTVEYGASVQLNADGAYIYYWIPNDGTLNNPNINDPIATPTKDTTYTVYGMDKNGCLDSATVQIDVTWDEEAIPSAFTPNGDGLNDNFRVVNMKYGKLLDMSIYNRWGQCVCHTTNNEVGWDGKFNGVPQDMDVYNYMIIIAHLDGTTKVYKGNLTLLR